MCTISAVQPIQPAPDHTHLEAEVTLLSLTPAVLPIKVEVSPLLVILRDRLWVVGALEPCQVLLVESPRLAFQFTSSKPPAQARQRMIGPA